MNSRIFNFAKELTTRRYIHDSTIQHIGGSLIDLPVSGYVGFDPTAPRIHLGNYLQIVTLFRGVQFGIRPIIVLGGATGGIGDPSGKTQERKVIEHSTLQDNTNIMKDQLTILSKNLISYIGKYHDIDSTFTIINNHDFYANMNVLDFFRSFGFHLRVSPMLAKENISQRLHSTNGITYTEFSYQIFQGIDYYHLFKTHVY